MIVAQRAREDVDVSGQVAAMVRDLRHRYGWSAQSLADRLAGIGFPQLNRSVLANIESGRRKQGVTVDELVALAHAFEVRPADLLP